MDVFNIRTGVLYSVTEQVEIFGKFDVVKLNNMYEKRCAGNLPECYANAGKAAEIHSWKTGKTLEDMCCDSWSWQKDNPNGYRE